MTKRSSSTRKSVVIEYESKEPDLTKFDEQYNLIKKMRGEGGIAEHATVDKLCLYFPDHHEKLESDEENEAILKIKRYRTLVCLMLSAQTKDTITVQVMEKLMNHGFTVDSLNETSLEDLTKLIFPVGFYKRKAEYIKKATKIVKDKYGGDVPNNVKEMMELPGVGPKMGYLCMNHAWSNVVGIGVDTHVRLT
jgi:endonuclease III